MGEMINSAGWEHMFAAYDPGTYQAVLAEIDPDDIVIEIGAGDLRLATQIAHIARKVYAVEINSDLLAQGKERYPFLDRLIAVNADAQTWDFPNDISVGVLLMRHCTHYQLYAKKLMAVGADRLITNARWRMGVETFSLQSPRVDYQKLELGWYACECGSVGFKCGPVEKLTPEAEAIINEVIHCPNCLDNQPKS